MNVAKDLICITSSYIFKSCYVRQFTETLNQFLNLSRANENMEICMPVLF